jgi:hypothetical protein
MPGTMNRNQNRNQNHNAEHSALIKELLLAINERYQPRCLVFNLNVIKAQRGQGWCRSAPDGTADIIGCIGDRGGSGGAAGGAVAIECKTGKGVLTKEQRAFRDAWQRAGGVYIVARDVDLTMCELAFALEGR